MQTTCDEAFSGSWFFIWRYGKFRSCLRTELQGSLNLSVWRLTLSQQQRGRTRYHRKYPFSPNSTEKTVIPEKNLSFFGHQKSFHRGFLDHTPFSMRETIRSERCRVTSQLHDAGNASKMMAETQRHGRNQPSRSLPFTVLCTVSRCLPTVVGRAIRLGDVLAFRKYWIHTGHFSTGGCGVYT
jgi:hypothetical protein